MDRQTDKKRTNEQTALHQFWKEPSYDGGLCPYQVWIWLDKPFSSKSPEMKNVDGQTDVGHINLIGGLATRNPPKNVGAGRSTLSSPVS